MSEASPSPALARFRPHGISSLRLAVAAAITLAACAPLEWRKDTADTAALDRDLAECQAQARLRAPREAPLFGFPRPAQIGTDSRGRIVMGQASRYDTDRAIAEHDLTNDCMRARGYELAPVKTSDSVTR